MALKDKKAPITTQDPIVDSTVESITPEVSEPVLTSIKDIKIKFKLNEEGLHKLKVNRNHYLNNFPWIDLESEEISVYDLTYLGELRDFVYAITE